MKNKYTFIRITAVLATVFIDQIASAQWSSVSPAGPAQWFSIYCTDASTAYVAGYQGKMKKTSNGGDTWDSLATGMNVDIKGVQFPTSSTGYAVGGTSLIKTTDGGTTWTLWTNNPFGTLGYYTGVYFTDANHGIVIGYFGSTGLIIQTTDGGGTWTVISQPYFYGKVNGVYFVNSSVGFMVGSGGSIAKTTDGGVTLSLQDSIGNGSTAFNAVHFSSVNVGYCVGDAGAMYKTSDGGSNWVALSPNTTANLSSVYFTDDNKGWAVGHPESNPFTAGIMLHTTDGGTTWATEILPSANSLNSICFSPDKTAAYTAGFMTVMKNSSPNSIKDETDFSDNVKIYPNPNDGKFNITVDTEKKEEIKVRVTNLIGDELLAEEIKNQGLDNKQVDLSSLSKGIYLVKVSQESSVSIKKIIIQ